MDNNHFPKPEKKPNINVPAGMTLEWNYNTGHWALRPISGYSTVYLAKKTFVPKTAEERKAENKEFGKTKNAKLHKARNDKYDEFYTRLEDITKELKHYKRFFEGKVVYCPCDKAFNLGRSNFFEFFASHFVDWGLKKLVATQYVENGHGWMWVIERGDVNGNGRIDESEIDTYELKGNGDFLSDECRKIMAESDIVCTNPPFSGDLFRPFVKQIMDLGKKFLILGNQNAITYKEIFPFIKENKMWLGYRALGTDMYFYIPDDYKKEIVKEKKEGSGWKIVNGEVMGRMASACWFTNLPHDKRKEDLPLVATYVNHESKYPHYDNYDAIDVSRVDDIPGDYYGVMGVPITFLGKYNPTQFEIVDARSVALGDKQRGKSTYLIKDEDGAINGKPTYARICIKRLSSE